MKFNEPFKPVDNFLRSFTIEHRELEIEPGSPVEIAWFGADTRVTPPGPPCEDLENEWVIVALANVVEIDRRGRLGKGWVLLLR